MPTLCVFCLPAAPVQTGLHWHSDAAEQWKCQPGSSSELRPRGRWLWHQLPTSQAWLCHQPLRAARCRDVWFHKHVRLWERCSGQGEIWTPAAGGVGWRQSARGKEKPDLLSKVNELGSGSGRGCPGQFGYWNSCGQMRQGEGQRDGKGGVFIYNTGSCSRCSCPSQSWSTSSL